MSNFRKFISLTAVAILGATNLLMPLSFASAQETPHDYGEYENIPTSGTAKSFKFIMPAYDVTFYAHTVANKYYVHFDGHDETTGSMANQEFTYDMSGDLNQNEFKKLGHTFLGWNESVDGSGTGHVDKEEVKNLTTENSGVVNMYAQWDVNEYNITYDLSDDDGGATSGVHSKEPSTGRFGQTLTITGATRVGYIFSGWYITNIDTTVPANEESELDHVMDTTFTNLRADTGTVNFAARWDPRTDTDYTVNHFLEKLSPVGTYPTDPEDTDNLTGTTNTYVTPGVNVYTGFDPATTGTQRIEADGSTTFRYEYPRKSYTLTLNAGRGIATATAVGTVNTTGATVNKSGTTNVSFRYEEPLTLSLTPLDGYEGETWSGYETTSGSFTMPADNIVKTAYATPIVYTIAYTYSGGNPTENPTSYTIESGEIVIPALNRVHSYFDGWSGGVNGGEQLASPQQSVTIPTGSTGNRTYVAMWTCYPGYHKSADEMKCNPDSDTEYRVRHYLQDFSGEYTILSGPSIGYTVQTGETDDVTDAHELVFEGFEVAHIDTGIIKGYEPGYSGITYVDITYNRLNYESSVDKITGVTSITHVGDNDGKNGTPSGNHQYNDVVTITATTGAGYTFSGWTIKDGSGNDITNLLDDPTAITTTFNMPASTVVIKANVTTNTYTISIDKKGGSGGTNSGETYTVEDTFEIENPSRDHSDFVGWSGTNLSEVTHDVTFSGRAYDSAYEAVWKCHTGYHASGSTSCVENVYTVTVDYKDAGNSEGTNTGTIEFKYDQEIEILNPTQSGYDFAGWTVTGLSGGNAKVDGVSIANNQTGIMGTGFKNLTVEEPGEVQLTAVWTKRTDTKYEVHHMFRTLGGNTYSEDATLVPTEYLSGETDLELTLANLAKTISGYTYTGGALTESSTLPTESFVATTHIDKYGNTVIYLYYTRDSYTVTIVPDAHTASHTGNGTYEFGATVSVDMEAEPGYHFTHWTKDPTAS